MSYASLVSPWRVKGSLRSFGSLTCCSQRRSSQSPFETRRSTKGRPLPLSLNPPSLRLPSSPVRRWFPRLARIFSPKRRPLPQRRSPVLQRHRANGRLGASRPGLSFAPFRRPKWNEPPHRHPLQLPPAEAHAYLPHLQALSPRHLPQRIYQHGMRRNIRLVLTSFFKGLACKRRRNFTSHRRQPNAID